MRCYICGKTYYIKRNLHTLFQEQTSFRCQSCFKKYKLSISYQVIPKQNGLYHIIALFNEKTSFNLMAFNDEIKAVINRILKQMTRKDTLLWVDEVTIELLKNFDELDNDIYIISNQIYL